MLQLLCQFLMAQLCHTFMITLWIVNRFGKHILRIRNIVSLFQWQLTQLADCQTSKCPPLARTQAQRRALHSLLALSTALCWRPCLLPMSNSSSTSCTRDWYTRC